MGKATVTSRERGSRSNTRAQPTQKAKLHYCYGEHSAFSVLMVSKIRADEVSAHAKLITNTCIELCQHVQPKMCRSIRIVRSQRNLADSSKRVSCGHVSLPERISRALSGAIAQTLGREASSPQVQVHSRKRKTVVVNRDARDVTVDHLLEVDAIFELRHVHLRKPVFEDEVQVRQRYHRRQAWALAPRKTGSRIDCINSR